MRLSGIMVTHQCEQFDYCYREALQSLIETCDEVIVVDGKSTDGTRDVLSSLPVTVIDADWSPVPGTVGKWLSDLYNLAKSKASGQFQLGLQADEVLHEIDRNAIRSLDYHTSFKRLNFWRDPQHYLAPGLVCGHRVFRYGTHEVKFVGDAEGMESHVRRDNSAVCIFHYGFLRKTENLIAKSISFEEEVFNTHNPLFDRMKMEGRRPFDEFYSELIPYNGPHPKYAWEWLEERGYNSGRYLAAQGIISLIKPEWTGVEIGVFRGDSSKLLLSRCRFMFLIDPCIPYEGNPDSTVYAVEQDVRRNLNGRNNYHFIRGMSHEVEDQISEVDFVFIDGNHTYEYVRKDIELYWPKVRSGGFISGHDFGEGFPGVVQAVTEFSARTNLPFSIHQDCWIIHKP